MGIFSRILIRVMLSVVLTAVLGGVQAQAGKLPTPPYTYYSVGTPDITPTLSQSRPHPSYVLMGGGPDVDEAFRWMIGRAGIKPGTGGRLVVIRATGDGAYDPYIYYSNANSSTSSADIVDGWVGGAALGLTSVETLVIPSVDAANDSIVNGVVGGANIVWIAGGDQSNYINYWKGTALEATLNALMAKNVPIGGTSAGLAVMGQFDFSALNGTVTSKQAMDNPYNKYMTFNPNPLGEGGGFIAPEALANTILDSHLDTRDRMGRLVTFVARLIKTFQGTPTQLFGCPGGVLSSQTARGIGVEVETALLVQGNPNRTYTGRRVTNVSTTTESAVYFVRNTQAPTVCAAKAPLTVPTSSVEIRKLADSQTVFDLTDWSGVGVYRWADVTSGVLSPANPY